MKVLVRFAIFATGSTNTTIPSLQAFHFVLVDPKTLAKQLLEAQHLPIPEMVSFFQA